MQSVRQIYRAFKPTLVVCDFDGTMTIHETITPLMTLAQTNWNANPQLMIDFDQHLEWYNSTHKVCHRTLLHNLQSYAKECKNRNSNNDRSSNSVDDGYNINGRLSLDSHLQRLSEYLSDCDKLDAESLQKMDAQKQYMAHITLADLQLLFKEYLRDNVKECFDEIMNDFNLEKTEKQKRKKRIKILSHNWSSHAIHGSVDEQISIQDICCNELQFVNSEQQPCTSTSGDFDLKCVTSFDKLKFVMDWKQEYTNTNTNTNNGGDDTDSACSIMYIGDSWGDLLASCYSDISVWMETESNHDFIETVNDVNLMYKTHDANRHLFVVDRW